MDIQSSAKQHIIPPNPAALKPSSPVPPSEQGVKNPADSGQDAPVSSEFAELEAAVEQMRAGEMILNAALAKQAEIEKYQKQQDRAELESVKEREYETPDDEAANERIMDRKLSEMLHWKYNSGLSVENNFSQIQSIFQTLLKDILSNYSGNLQLELMAQLDAFTLNAIQQLVNGRFQELLDFLGQYGRPESEAMLVNGLFENMSGRKPLICNVISVFFF